MVTDELPFIRGYWTEFTYEDRLIKYIPFYWIPRKEIAIVREILDNALDAAEQLSDLHIDINIECRRWSLFFSVTNPGSIPDILLKPENFFNLGSTKFEFKKITRGLIGQGLKAAVMVYLLFLTPLTPFIIETGGKKYSIEIKDIDAVEPQDVLNITQSNSNLDKRFTRVSFEFQKRSSFKENEFLNYVKSYIIVNPHISFTLNINNKLEEYPPTGSITINKKADITHYDFNKFKKLFKLVKKGAIVEFSIEKFISLFNVPDSVLKDKLKSKQDFFNELSLKENLSDSEIEYIYNFIRENSKKVPLPDISKEMIQERLKQFNCELNNFYICRNSERNKNNDLIDVLFFASYKVTGNSALNQVTVSYNGSVIDFEGTQWLDKKPEEKLSKYEDYNFLLIYYTTNLDNTGENKDLITIPFKLGNILKKIPKQDQQSSEEKLPFSWLLRRDEYISYVDQITQPEKIYIKKTPDDVKNEIENRKEQGEKLPPFNPIIYYFWNDCYEIVEPIYNEYGPITIRSLYYRLVSKGIMKPGETSYKSMNQYISLARKIDCIPWNFFCDPSKPFFSPTPADSLDVPPEKYLLERIQNLEPPLVFDEWSKRRVIVEVWIEKEAMLPIIRKVTDKYNIGIQCTRGFSSITKEKEAELRIKSYLNQGYSVKIFYFGDFNPTGVLIYEKIEENFKKFKDKGLHIEKLAINKQQTDELKDLYNPEPINEKDPNAKKFIKKYETKNCFELEAMEPKKIEEILTKEIEELRKDDYTNFVKTWHDEFKKYKEDLLNKIDLLLNENKTLKKD